MPHTRARRACEACVCVCTVISYVSKSRLRLFSAPRLPTPLGPASSQAGWLRRSGADDTRPRRRLVPRVRPRELRAPHFASEVLGAGQREGWSQLQYGCRSSQHDATARFCDGDEQRSHCIARPSDAVAALLTALAAVERCGAPHSWHDEEHAGCVPELAAVARRHEDVSRSHADSQESPPGRSRGTMARRERSRDRLFSSTLKR